MLNGENDVELVEDDTWAWVQRTFYENFNKKGCLGGKKRTEKNGEKWKAIDLLNKVERVKRRTEKSLTGYQKRALEPLNITNSLSYIRPQKAASDLSDKPQIDFRKGIIKLGPAGNSKSKTIVKILSLRKEIDYHNVVRNQVSEPMKTKSLWAQRSFRNPKRKPFPWGFHNYSGEEGEYRKEILEEGIEMREEDMDCLHERNSSDSEDTDGSKDKVLCTRIRE